MTEQAPHELFDFTNMPITNEQRMLETLIRIEQLLIARFDDAAASVSGEPQGLIKDITPSKTPFMARKGRK